MVSEPHRGKVGEMVVLFGAGTTGRVVARKMREQGTEFVFADNDVSKWNKPMEGVMVLDPTVAKILYPAGEWICTAMQPKFREGINADLERLGVKVEPVWPYLPDHCQSIPFHAMNSVLKLCADQLSVDYLRDQFHFRAHNSLNQIPTASIDEIYFPSWISHLDNEHYVDCGAADGDTIDEFRKRWDKWDHIYAFEPDFQNFGKLTLKHAEAGSRVRRMHAAVGDVHTQVPFCETGDYSAHVVSQSDLMVWSVRLDDVLLDTESLTPPTYIKMDIEGSELEALWGAREIIKEHSPVLAICAYHKADHLWQIPLLIHAIQPEYKLFLRRYAEEVWELVWYAVPVERLVK